MVKVRAIDVLLFESWSLLKVILHVKAIRNARNVLFFPKSLYGGRRDKEPAAQKIIRRLINWINPEAKVRPVQMEETADYHFDVSEDAVKLLDEKSADIQGTASYKLLHGVVHSDHIVKFYQIWLVRIVIDRYAYAKLYEELKSKNENVVSVSNGSMEFLGAFHPPLQDGGGSRYSRFATKFTNILQAYGWRLACLLLPGAIFLRCVKNGRVSSALKRYALAMPVIHGIFNDGVR